MIVRFSSKPIATTTVPKLYAVKRPQRFQLQVLNVTVPIGAAYS